MPNEGHTLGNILRSILANNADVEFVGYSVPHPTQPEMYLRLQTHDRPAADVLHEALEQLEFMCDKIGEEYESAMKRFSE
ncbi:MAG: hypothetical protein KVP17_001143 [Porospora cf. gigantea B]|nr:MAG: hypothetical protein KVP17_001143 [Porospora cf. gigantea B]